mmetsp:Transcript_25099/g.58184  ORF Transcript_25099/g.58184 Transcript_25099/m.58184 type:complete len:429 (-) Transcript_25099:71-1357(-)
MMRLVALGHRLGRRAVMQHGLAAPALARWHGGVGQNQEPPSAQDSQAGSGKSDFSAVWQLAGLVATGAGVSITLLQYNQAQRDSERAFRESPEGRLQEAVRVVMRPFEPKMAKEQVVARKVIEEIKSRIGSWEEHATIVTGRHGCGKSVALQEALRGLPGTFVHTVDNAEWKDTLYKELHLDGSGMLKDLFKRVAAELKKDPEALSKVPILVLDIPRETTEGMKLVSNLAKEMSSDKMGCAAHVIVCASSAGTAMTFDAGGAERQVNFWVEDLTEQEAQEMLKLKGHAEDWKQFTAACGLNALDLTIACREYTGPNFLETMRRKKEAKARDEVLTFYKDCKVQNAETFAPVGRYILEALLANRKSGDGQGVEKPSAGTAAVPKEVTHWMRQKGCHPVIWHTTHEMYKFSSERHAEAAAKILNRRWWPF